MEILGVYTTSRKEKVGDGGMRKEYIHSIYWLVVTLGENSYIAVALNDTNLPTSVYNVVTTEELLKSYTPDPKYYLKNVYPVIRSLQTKLKTPEGAATASELSERERHFLVALKLDDISKRSEESGFSRARRIILGTPLDEGEFNFAQRKQLNTFGISLRKQKNYDEAIKFYQKGLEVNPDDDHLVFNIARAYFEKGLIAPCKRLLEKALSMNPELKEARRFAEFLETQGKRAGSGRSMPQKSERTSG
ncbi:tetratricopeptide repeat protein [Desulfovibrio inopinatus]|uniref:tetratricopeptide repeat protein n=1 Tax=Desulfovibrio inopinatus TaxID=102109 RepID=UPI0004248847|nr:tetratricopeptide repeat protein [Desulfovibrio inopinatus]